MSTSPQYRSPWPRSVDGVSSVAPRLGREARLEHLLKTAPSVVEEVGELAALLKSDPQIAGTARRLCACYRNLRVAAGELGLVHLSRVARAGEVFAQLVSTQAITPTPRHFLMLGEVRDGVIRLLHRVRSYWTDAAGSREASHVMNVVLSSEPIVGALLLQRSVVTASEPL